MLTDSHAHLNFSAYDKDLKDVIKRCNQNEMIVINVGSQLDTSKKACQLAKEHNNFFASVGVHPIHLGNSKLDQLEAKEHKHFLDMSADQTLDELDDLAKNEKVVAIGETGLDYYHLLDKEIKKTKKLQMEYFVRHIELSQKNNLPLVLHCRGAKEDPFVAYFLMYDILKTQNGRGVLHCFGGNYDIAKKFIDMGYYIGFTGVITFKKGNEELQSVVKKIPMDRILIETDCPYITPEPLRGQRNEPANVKFIAAKVAELKGLTVEEVIEATYRNSRELFNLQQSENF